jgi:hypothetical protein
MAYKFLAFITKISAAYAVVIFLPQRKYKEDAENAKS